MNIGLILLWAIKQRSGIAVKCYYNPEFALTDPVFVQLFTHSLNKLCSLRYYVGLVSGVFSAPLPQLCP